MDRGNFKGQKADCEHRKSTLAMAPHSSEHRRKCRPIMGL